MFPVVDGDMLHFRKKLLDTFNGARSMIAGGTLSPMVDLINELKNGTLHQFGPAANMHKLVSCSKAIHVVYELLQKWSRHLEQHAYLHMKAKGFSITDALKGIDRNGLVGFYWTGTILVLARQVIKFIPMEQIEEVLTPLLDIVSHR